MSDNSVENNWQRLQFVRKEEVQSMESPPPKDASTEITHWAEHEPRPFTRKDRASTTIWMAGLSQNHDALISAGARGLGYKMHALPVPDNEALTIGKEYGNRGQCNPTYYTVGNLVKHIKALEANGVPRERILEDYVFFTAASCGPCRFGMYATEYRKALREAGLEGFRVQQLLQTDLARGDPADNGLDFNVPFIRTLVKAIVAADVINLIGHRIRPYELERGATDAVLDECRELVAEALEQRQSVLKALRNCRRRLKNIAVDRLQPKPTVCVIGEIWAMTTEGDGNYEMHRFLEDEGAEVLVQPIFNWLLFLLWERKRDISIRKRLRGEDSGNRGLKDKDPWLHMLLASMLEPVLIQTIRTFARAVGLSRLHIVDLNEMAKASHEYYDNDIRGGEAFMEVGKFIDSAENNRAHLVVSVKPFGCLPSSGVSDGVQSLVTSRNPDTAFYSIETTGDGRVSAHSRIQMMLFNAHARARAELEQALGAAGMDADEARRRLLCDRKLNSAIFCPHQRYATTAANMVTELA